MPGKVLLEIENRLIPYDLPSYFYLYREEGGLPEPGTYRILPSTSSSYEPTDFTGEFNFRCSTLSPSLCPQGRYELGGGTLVIESTEGSRYRGHFQMKGATSRPLPGYIDVSGEFDIPYVKSSYF
jgi:hypothetical protein